MDSTQNSHKLRFRSLCVAVGITEQSLYQTTFVNPNFINSMFAGISVPADIADEVVKGFNVLAKTNYNLSDFEIATNEDVKGC